MLCLFLGSLEVLGNEPEPAAQRGVKSSEKAEDGHGSKLVSAAGVP